MFILAEELKNQGFELRELIDVHSQRMISHKMLHKAIREIEKVYLNMFP